MLTLRLKLRVPAVGELAQAVALACAVGLLAAAGVDRLGTIGLLLPLGLLLVVMLLMRPLVAVTVAVGLAVLCEGTTFGLLHFTSNLYRDIYKSITPLDVLVVLAIVSVGVDLIRDRRPLWVPRPLAFALGILALAMVAGAAVGHSGGISLRAVILAENTLAYLLLLPIAVANLKIDRRQVKLLLGGAMALAILKAVLGLIEIADHLGTPIEGSSTLTYYEPAANWLIMVAALTLFAAIVIRERPPLWMCLGGPLLAASLVLSYRRSFWIAAVLGILLVLVLGLSPAGRRLLVPTGLAVAAAIWLLGSVNFQSQLPIAKRVASLSPAKLEANAEDRYRINERANVLGAIGEHPITGLGVLVPWQATFQPLSLEHPNGREYVHFAALWYWLKLGILGLVAYIAFLLGAAVLAWRVWRRSREPLLRAFGIASLCGLAGLVAIETTASFTGVDLRFTVLLSAQVGLLALLGGRDRQPQ